MAVGAEIPSAVDSIITVVALSSGRPAVSPWVAWYRVFGEHCWRFCLWSALLAAVVTRRVEWLDVTASRCASSSVSLARIPEHNL